MFFMTRARGIRCSCCSIIIDRYDDTIKCIKCNRIYHIKCVNNFIEEFNNIRGQGLQGEWSCESCTKEIQSNIAVQPQNHSIEVSETDNT